MTQTDANLQESGPSKAKPDANYYQSTEFKTRIEGMFTRDCIFGMVFVVWLWLTYAFVFFMIRSQSDAVSGEVQLALAIAGLLVCIFNTGAITNMVRNLSQNKTYIYTVDLRHYDAIKAAK